MPEIPKLRPAARVVPLEREVMHAIRERLGLEPDLVLWRNQVGHDENWDARTGKVWHQHAGLPNGSSDLIGILRVSVIDVRAEHGTRDFGRFFCLEVKRMKGSRYEPGQLEFLELVRSFGGFAARAPSVHEAVAALERARRGECQ